jgi:hypothetical protein
MQPLKPSCFGGGLRVLQRDLREAVIAVRPLLDFRGEEVVRLGGLVGGARGVGLDLHAGAGDREHGFDDARRVHLLEPQLAEIGETRVDWLEHLRRHERHGGPPVFLEPRRHEVLFERDFLDQGSLQKKPGARASHGSARPCETMGRTIRSRRIFGQ